MIGELPSRSLDALFKVNKFRKKKPVKVVKKYPVNNKRLSENRQQEELIKERRLVENQKKWGAFLATVNTPEFRMWYEKHACSPWPQRFMDFPDEGFYQVQRILERIEYAEMKDAERRSHYKELCHDPDLTCHGRRRARQILATPPWVDWGEIRKLEEKRDKYNELYPDEAPFHIDHIIPIQGDIVCGLHVHTNMQVISATENIRKSNKF